MTWGANEVQFHLNRLHEGIHARSQETLKHIDQITANIERATLLQETTPNLPTPEELHRILARVHDALRRHVLSDVSRRDARVALRCFDQFSAADVQRLAKRFGERYFVKAFFERRLEPKLDASWVKIVSELPPTLPLLDGTGISREALFESNGFRSAMRVAQALAGSGSLSQILSKLCRPDLLNPRWPYTRMTLAYAAHYSQQELGLVWREITQDALIEAMLLPDGRQSGVSRFRRGERLTSMLACAEAPCIMAMQLINEQLKGSPVGESWHWVFFESRDFRDPREFDNARSAPATQGWKLVRDFNRQLYEKFVDGLVAEDIRFFFDNANIVEGRREFWEGYLGQITSTRCYLSARNHAELENKFSAADDKVRAVVRRAHRFRETAGANALCLFFPGAVAVEFSDAPNAAYLYSLADFDRVLATNPKTAKSLKRPELGGLKMSHMGYWQRSFADRLRQNGVSAPL